MKRPISNCFLDETIDRTSPFTRGVVLIESFTRKISSAFFFFFCENFGKVTRFFFLPFYKKKKVIGWIEFSNKINAKRASIFFRRFFSHSPAPWSLIKLRYLKHFDWKKIISQTKEGCNT